MAAASPGDSAPFWDAASRSSEDPAYWHGGRLSWYRAVMERLGEALRIIGHTWGRGAVLLMGVVGAAIVCLVLANFLASAAASLFPGMSKGSWFLAMILICLPLGVGWGVPSIRGFSLDESTTLAAVGGWMAIVTIYDIDSMAIVVLGMVVLGSIRIASLWIVEWLWNEEPRTRLVTGAALIVGAMVIFAAVDPISLLPAAPEDAFSWPLATLAISYAAIVGGILLSLTLIASGSRQAIQRWRYRRSIQR